MKEINLDHCNYSRLHPSRKTFAGVFWLFSHRVKSITYKSRHVTKLRFLGFFNRFSLYINFKKNITWSNIFFLVNACPALVTNFHTQDGPYLDLAFFLQLSLHDCKYILQSSWHAAISRAWLFDGFCQLVSQLARQELFLSSHWARQSPSDANAIFGVCETQINRAEARMNISFFIVSLFSAAEFHTQGRPYRLPWPLE